MLPILGGSRVALAIILERLWTLQARRIAPGGLGQQVCELISQGQVNVYWLESQSPLDCVLATGLRDARLGNETVRAHAGIFFMVSLSSPTAVRLVASCLIQVRPVR